MIVNTAYPYMGKTAKVNPIIFDQNGANYPYSGVGYSVETALGTSAKYFVMDGTSELIFSDLDLTKFAALSVPGRHNYTRNLRMTAIFIDDSGNASSGVTVSYKANTTTTGVWEIPQQFRAKKCKVKFTTDNASELKLYSATLS